MTSIRQLAILMTLASVVCLGDFGWALPLVEAAVPARAGIWGSREARYSLTEEHQRVLLSSLRRITGLGGLDFAADGSLSLGETRTSDGGAEHGRQVLLDALQSGLAFIIEDHSGSAAVNFGQLDEGLIYENPAAGLRLTVFRVRLDFEDFRAMQAPPEVRASFDEGFTLLHELLHGLGLKDTLRSSEVGECEVVLNRVRAELRLPLRDEYLAGQTQLAPGVVSIRLRFSSPARLPGFRAQKCYYLFFLPHRRLKIRARPGQAPPPLANVEGGGNRTRAAGKESS